MALLIGASSGMSAALAGEAAKDGHGLGLVARRREPMEALAVELKATGADSTIILADLSKPSAAAILMQAPSKRASSSTR